ncbi:MAG: putative porin [Dysgonamonadaceae bacterium]|jgi:hypothetical protein|nr:putative porin [Dysgonamonadaceae bacterium]
MTEKKRALNKQQPFGKAIGRIFLLVCCWEMATFSLFAQPNPIKKDSLALPIDTAGIRFWQITERTGAIIPVLQPDTFLTDYFNRTNVEGNGISVAYLGNLGLPMESRIFFERKDRSEFMFMDPFYAYAQTPDNFQFINTKIPYSTISYQTAGGSQNKEERLKGILAVNLGKKLNAGFLVDYIYARGFYESQASKHLEWVFFGNYIADRHRLHLFVNPANYTNGENGGLLRDNFVSHPDWEDSRITRSKDFPTRLTRTWNHLQGNRYFLNYYYNLGFEKETGRQNEEGEDIKQFVPVSSLIYTFDFDNRKRNFYTENQSALSEFYNRRDSVIPQWKDRITNDSTSYYSMKNTLGISLREGFSDWAKFDLTAYATYDHRQFTMMDTTLANYRQTLNSLYIGGEIAKNTGKILRYNAQGSLGIAQANAGDFNVSGRVETRIPLLNDTASVTVGGFIKSLSPTFYEQHYRSQYFWWDNTFDKVRKYRLGGEIQFPYTRTVIGLDLENVTNYLYFDPDGRPQQAKENIQVIGANVKQNLKYRALHWDTQVYAQFSSNDSILPLPQWSIYSSLFVQFKIAKVLTVQLGANVHYWTAYRSPTYEPATQQFRLQNPKEEYVKIGNYPLINGFINCHLKQTRFFLEYYNAGAMFISPPEYFSIPHYPVDPTVLKLGLAVHFIN